jgi:hypothetical protein
VTESREVDRELQAQDTGYDLDDFWRGVLLLLFLDASGRGSTVFRV